MLRSGAISSIKDLWWDIRLQPGFGTIEIRTMDGMSTISETLALVAFVHSLCAMLDQQYLNGARFAPPAYWVLRENKWRASRWGIEAHLVVNEGGETAPLRAEIQRLIAEVTPYAAALGCTKDITLVRDILNRPTSSERQRRHLARTGSLHAVVDSLVEELRSDIPVF